MTIDFNSLSFFKTMDSQKMHEKQQPKKQKSDWQFLTMSTTTIQMLFVGMGDIWLNIESIKENVEPGQNICYHIKWHGRLNV